MYSKLFGVSCKTNKVEHKPIQMLQSLICSCHMRLFHLVLSVH